jgi:hypothetical protein
MNNLTKEMLGKLELLLGLRIRGFTDNIIIEKNVTSRMTGGIVFLILVSYIPYLAQWQMDIFIHRDVSLLSTATLAFRGKYYKTFYGRKLRLFKLS